MYGVGYDHHQPIQPNPQNPRPRVPDGNSYSGARDLSYSNKLPNDVVLVKSRWQKRLQGHALKGGQHFGHFAPNRFSYDGFDPLRRSLGQEEILHSDRRAYKFQPSGCANVVIRIWVLKYILIDVEDLHRGKKMRGQGTEAHHIRKL